MGVKKVKPDRASRLIEIVHQERLSRAGETVRRAKDAVSFAKQLMGKIQGKMGDSGRPKSSVSSGQGSASFVERARELLQQSKERASAGRKPRA